MQLLWVHPANLPKFGHKHAACKGVAKRMFDHQAELSFMADCLTNFHVLVAWNYIS